MSKKPPLSTADGLYKTIFKRLLPSTQPKSKQERHDQVYAVMTDVKLRNLATLNTPLEVMKYAETVDPQGNHKWLYTARSNSYGQFISMIANALNQEKKIRKSKEEIVVNVIGHGIEQGIVYSGRSSVQSQIISLPQFVQDVALNGIRGSTSQRLGFYFSGCHIGVGIGSTSKDPEKIARREAQEREMQEKLPANTICMAAAGNKIILGDQDEEITKEIAKQKYSTLEKAVISASILPKTFKLIYKSEKGALFTHKSNFEIPTEDNKINHEYIAKQIKKRMVGVVQFAIAAKFDKEEISSIQAMQLDLQSKITPKSTHEYLVHLLVEKAFVSKKFDLIFSKIEEKEKIEIFKDEKSFKEIITALVHAGSAKTAISLVNDRQSYIDRGIVNSKNPILNVAVSNVMRAQAFLEDIVKGESKSILIDSSLIFKDGKFIDEDFFKTFLKVAEEKFPQLSDNIYVLGLTENALPIDELVNENNLQCKVVKMASKNKNTTFDIFAGVFFYKYEELTGQKTESNILSPAVFCSKDDYDKINARQGVFNVPEEVRLVNHSDKFDGSQVPQVIEAKESPAKIPNTSPSLMDLENTNEKREQPKPNVKNALRLNEGATRLIDIGNEHTGTTIV